MKEEIVTWLETTLNLDINTIGGVTISVLLLLLALVRGKSRERMVFSSRKGQRTYVYVMYCRNHIKVGISNNPARRRDTFQTGNPYPIVILVTIRSESRQAAFEIESWLHGKLSRWRVGDDSEWFKAEANSALTGLLNDLDDWGYEINELEQLRRAA